MDVREFKPLHELIKDLVIDETSLHSSQCRSLTKYLTELGAKSVVVEESYNDAGYLVEYSNYYSRCHDEYKRYTWRVHFFDVDVDVLSTLLDLSMICLPETDQEGKINESYLGFIVVKPLPRTIIGRTCLKTYPEHDMDSGRKRVFPILRKYNVLLYGLKLNVDSIAFQEQDSEIAACSTAAIWFALHALTGKFTTQEIASTYEITHHASATYIKRAHGEVARRFPTSGLGLEQIEAYLRSVGMECIVCGANLGRTSLQTAEYLSAYASAGFPMILVGNLYVSSKAESQYRKLGLHAMTALGYAAEEKFSPGSKATRIRRIFAHDDNVGPFTSYHVENCEKGDFVRFLSPSPIIESGKEKSIEQILKSMPAMLAAAGSATVVEQNVTGYLSNESGLPKDGKSYRKFIPEYFVIPVHHKVRFPCEGISLFASQIDATYRRLSALQYPPRQVPPRIAWSMFLLDVEDFKSRIRKCVTLDQEAVIDVLLMPLPKKIWVLSFSTESSEACNSPIVDFIFDATSLRQKGGLIGMLPYEELEESFTFSSIVSMFLHEYDEAQILNMDIELQPIMRAARKFMKEQLQEEIDTSSGQPA